MAEASGGRTHRRQENLPPAGFEDRDDHRTACASVNQKLPRNFFAYCAGAAVFAGLAATGAARASATGFGSLSAFATSRLIARICVSDNVERKPGMPVRRMPFATFQ